MFDSVRITFFKVLIFFLGISFFFSCNENANRNEVIHPSEIDTSGTFRLHLTDFFTDSAAIDSFISRHPEIQSDSGLLFDFYRRRNFRFAWINKEGVIEHSAHLINLISGSTTIMDTSIAPRLQTLFDAVKVVPLAELHKSGIAEEMELNFTSAFFDFARKEYVGVEDSVFRNLDWFIPRKKLNFDGLLDSILNKSPQEMANTEPVYYMYSRLKSYLNLYTELACNETWDSLSQPTKELKPGKRDSIVPIIKIRLQLLGDLLTNDTSDVYSDSLISAIRRFQFRHGLKATGIPDKEFFEALNVKPEERLRQLLVNMERCRWLPIRPKGENIVINLPEYKMYVNSDEKTLWECNVIVGKTSNNTVIFTDSLEYIVFNPYWNVPDKIIFDEIAPEMINDPSYMKSHHMELVSYSNPSRVVDPKSIDWKNPGQNRFPYLLRQKPGPWNALGSIKFLFPNNFSIYLHDTPEKKLFDKQERSFSHGCIRIQEPLKLAEFLLKDDSLWNKKNIQKTLKEGKEKFVKLIRKVPVSILYFTAWVDDAGVLNFRKDVYGHDMKMEKVVFEF